MIKQAFRRYGIGECTLCDREWDENQGIAGYVFKQNRKINEQYTRNVGICDTCLKQIRLAEVLEPKSENKVFITGCLAPLKGFGKLEQVQLDGGEIKPGSIKQEEAVQFNEGGNTYFKGEIKIKCQTPDELTKEQIKDMARQVAEESMNKHKHLLEDLKLTTFSTEELKATVEQLKMLREIEKEARLNAEALKQQFERDPLLLKVYLSSAEYVMEKVGKAIDDLIEGLL